MADNLPISEITAAIDRQDFNWYSNLSKDNQKKWSSWLCLRYASSIKGSQQGEALLTTNEFVNKHYIDLYKSDDLIWRLMCITGTGKKQFHEWIKPPSTKKSKDKISNFVLQAYPHMKTDDIELFRTLNDDSDIKRLAVDMGIPDKEIDEIFGKTKKKKK